MTSPTLSIFSTAKPFRGLFAVIQENAIRSWVSLDPRPSVILFGDDEGSAEIAARLGLTYVPDVARNPNGIPLVNDMFEQAQRLADTDLVCFINSDIVVSSLFIAALDSVAAVFNRFLMVGERCDLRVVAPLEFETAGWEDDLLRRAKEEGKGDGPLYIDYFAFPRGAISGVPPFAIGRTSYDNWLIWHAGVTGCEVVDASAFVPAVHQHHDYSHGGNYEAIWTGDDAVRARELVGHWSRYHTVADARWMLTTDGQLVRARGVKYAVARPRRFLGAMLGFTRPLRRRLKSDE